MRNIDLGIIHCSASDRPEDDSVEAIQRLHTSTPDTEIRWGKYDTHGKGWTAVGYHYLITKDGVLHQCRPLHIRGAHCVGFNSRSIGICLSGDTEFTEAQFDRLRSLRTELEWLLGDIKYLPHNHLSKHKTCPNFKLEDVWTT